VRIVLITGDDLEHRYLSNRLSAELEVAAIVVDRGVPKGKVKRLKQIWRRYSLPQLASRLVSAILRKVGAHARRHRERLVAIFGAEKCLQFADPELVHYVVGVNSAQTEKLVADLRPDLILVFGTAIVKDRILSKASVIALNMHTGISPFYRGCDCTFWPVHNGEPEMLGATVHECTQDIDGGKLFGTTRSDLAAEDCLSSIFARCVVAGSELYIETVKGIVDGTARAVLQDLRTGTEYKAHQRGLRAEMKAQRNIRRGLIKEYLENIHPVVRHGQIKPTKGFGQ
jgi:methionyl-tRNA formyltransferase